MPARLQTDLTPKTPAPGSSSGPLVPGLRNSRGADERSRGTRFDDFLRELNTERPHEALDMKRPADVHTPSRKPFTGLADLTRGGTRRFATFHSACHRATTFLEPRGEGTGTYGLPDAPRGSLRAARRDRI